MDTEAAIRVLDPQVARKIAAGEVIERPASIVRELIDNAVDARATQVTLTIEEGGLQLIRVQDDGAGMSHSDVSLCTLSHATSKIRSEEDLRSCRSLGFRGEALASIAAVARLRISTRSRTADDSGAMLEANAGGAMSVSSVAAPYGTTVEVRELFYSQPARKRFLKNSSAESKQVKATFIDKALPFPELEFRYFVGDKLRLFLAPATQVERIQACYPEVPHATLLSETQETHPGFRLQVVTADPGLFRRDRRLLQVFINGRRVNEYAFQQAVQFAYEPYLPGGLIPVAWVFLHVDPELVDFNVHPAKREVRLRNKQEIHESIVALVRRQLQGEHGATLDAGRSSSVTPTMPHRPGPRTHGMPHGSRHRTPPHAAGTPQAEWYRQQDQPEADSVVAEAPGPELNFSYLGTVFGVFWLVSLGETLLIIDQHAVHERLIYDELRTNPRRQELLVPVEFSGDTENRERILSRLPSFAALGLDVMEVRPGVFHIIAVPAGFERSPGSLVAVLTAEYNLHEQQSTEFFARQACRAAVKDGDLIDASSAEELISRALRLENPRCPHGRPLWHAVSKADLFRAVGRTF